MTTEKRYFIRRNGHGWEIWDRNTSECVQHSIAYKRNAQDLVNSMNYWELKNARAAHAV